MTSDADFREWEKYFKDATLAGRRLRYLDAGEGPPILLLHGLGASWRVWYLNLPALIADHRVIVVDLPGFGGSQDLVRPTGIDDYAASLTRLLDFLGIDDVAVVGHSLGGVVAQRLAVTQPARLRALILVSTARAMMTTRTRTLFKAAALGTVPLGLVPKTVMLPAVRNLMSIAGVRRWILSRMVHDPDQLPSGLGTEMLVSAMSSRGTAAAIRAGLDLVLDNRLQTVRCPVLVVGGDKDRVISAAATADLTCQFPRATQIMWEGVGHHPMWERPGDFDELVCGFLRDHYMTA